ncbi:predicted protein [Nematostella vectensis]|uniref:Uncharacterized protein n=2 Tax=Nematostella vectensis TaxID=45351 RepID=A7RKG6_NEMVE|nr:predicted protein [Nematostella vectensis]|eukprot:XP_001640043.1 predicted protein [Nematostella vectensis]
MHRRRKTSHNKHSLVVSPVRRTVFHEAFIAVFIVLAIVLAIFYWIVVEMIDREEVRSQFGSTWDKAKKSKTLHDVNLQSVIENSSDPRMVVLYRNGSSSISGRKYCVSEPWMISSTVGLAGFLLMTLDHFGVCYVLGGNPTVTWKNCQSVCSKDNTDSWSMFFQPVNPGIKVQRESGICLVDFLIQEKLEIPVKVDANGTLVTPESLLNLSFKKRNAEGFENSGIITKRSREWANFLIKKYIRVQKHIGDSTNEYYNNHLKGYNVLAVHVRGTDHYLETENRKLLPISLWIEKAEQVYSTLSSPRRIFIASDNIEVIHSFVKQFGSKTVFFTKAYRARRYHGQAVHDSGLDPYKLGSQVLIDILLMSKCSVFLHSESSVAALVAYFNPDLPLEFLEQKPSKISVNGPIKSSSTTLKSNQIDQKKDDEKEDVEDEDDKNEEEEEEEKEDEDGEDEPLSCLTQNLEYSACFDKERMVFMKPKEIIAFMRK